MNTLILRGHKKWCQPYLADSNRPPPHFDCGRSRCRVAKSIETGLMLKELQTRCELKSVLTICPKPFLVELERQNEMKHFDFDRFVLPKLCFSAMVYDI